MQTVRRPVLDWPRDSKGLYLQPTLREYQDPKLQTLEQHNRDRAAAKADYSDQTTGNARTIDPLGRYNCGRCNQEEDKACELMDMDLLPGHKLHLESDSCGKWEIICAGDAEIRFRRYSPVKLGFARAANGYRFGCEVCPLKVKAHVPDSLGRSYWCGWWYMRVFPNACCNDNATKEVPIKFPEAAYE